MSTELKAATHAPCTGLTEDEVKRIELALCFTIRMMTDHVTEMMDDLDLMGDGLRIRGDNRGVDANPVYISFARDIRLYLELMDKVQQGWIGPNPGHLLPGWRTGGGEGTGA